MRKIFFSSLLLILAPFLHAQTGNKCLVILNDQDCINCMRAIWGVSLLNASFDTRFVVPQRMESYAYRLLTEVGNVPESHIKLLVNDSLYEYYRAIYPRSTLLVISSDKRILYAVPLEDVFNNTTTINAFSHWYHQLDTLALLTQSAVSERVQVFGVDVVESFEGLSISGLYKDYYLLDELFGDIWKINKDTAELLITQTKLNADSLRRRFVGYWSPDLDSASKYDQYLKALGYNKPSIMSIIHNGMTSYACVKCPFPVRDKEHDKFSIDVENIYLMVPFKKEFDYRRAIPVPRLVENAFRINLAFEAFWRDSLIYFSIYRYDPDQIQTDDPVLCSFRVFANNSLAFSRFLPISEPAFFSENGLKNELNGNWIRDGVFYYAHAPQMYNLSNEEAFPALDFPVKNRVQEDNSPDFPLLIKDVKVIENKITLVLANLYNKEVKSSSLILYYFNTETGSLLDEKEIAFSKNDKASDARILSDLSVLIFSKNKYLVRIK